MYRVFLPRSRQRMGEVASLVRATTHEGRFLPPPCERMGEVSSERSERDGGGKSGHFCMAPSFAQRFVNVLEGKCEQANV
jgi:hypothetical protein